MKRLEGLNNVDYNTSSLIECSMEEGKKGKQFECSMRERNKKYRSRNCILCS
jgi:hypothetical protein